MPITIAAPKNLDSYHKEATRLSRWAQRRSGSLKLKYRAIFEVESEVEYIDLSTAEKAVKAQEYLDEYVDYYKELGRWEGRDEPGSEALTVTPEDVHYFNYRLLRQGPALRMALTVATLDRVETLKFRSHIVKMMGVADKALEAGDITVAIRFWKQINDARKDMEHFLRLTTDNKLRKENVALKKGLARAYEQLAYWEGEVKKLPGHSGAPKPEETVDGNVITIVSLEQGKGMQEVEDLVSEGEGPES